MAIRSSPLFNIVAHIPLPLLGEQEARQLIASTDVRFDEFEVESIIGLAGCHPRFLHAACSFLLEAHERGGRPPGERLDMVGRELSREAAPHLSELWENSPDQERILLTALALLERQGKAGRHGFSLGQLRTLYGRSDQMLTHLIIAVASKSGLRALTTWTGRESAGRKVRVADARGAA